MGFAKFGKRDGPNRSLVAALGMERLIPASVVQIIVALVLAFFRRSAALAKMTAAAFHF